MKLGARSIIFFSMSERGQFLVQFDVFGSLAPSYQS